MLHGKLDEAKEMKAELELEGMRLGDIAGNSAEVVRKFNEALKPRRGKLQGRGRTRMILDAGGKSSRSQEKKQRAATKREANTIMERTARGAIATVTVGAGDSAEILPGPGPREVAHECCEWGARPE